MNKSESKYFNTALRMDEALLALLEEKDLEYITVKEICRQAGVNRSTFYLHYETVADLVNETLEMIDQRFRSYFPGKGRRFWGIWAAGSGKTWCWSPGNICCPISASSGITKRSIGRHFGTQAACRPMYDMGN